MSNPDDDSGPAFPPVIKINGRNYVTRHALENYKAALVSRALGGEARVVRFDGPDTLIPFRNVGAELGVSRRTIARRMDEAAERRNARHAELTT